MGISKLHLADCTVRIFREDTVENPLYNEDLYYIRRYMYYIMKLRVKYYTVGIDGITGI